MAKVGRPRTRRVDLRRTRSAYITPIQLAEFVGVTRRTIYHHIEKGALATVKLVKNGAVRIPTDVARRYAGISV